MILNLRLEFDFLTFLVGLENLTLFFKTETPTIDEILRWAQMMRGETIIDDSYHLVIGPDLLQPLKTGIPVVYGFNSIEDCID